MTIKNRYLSRLLTHWPILIIFIAGIFFRTRFISQGNFLFSYDQARDAYEIKQLLSGDIKIQGPPTSTRDFFHGVLYYYVLAPGYLIGNGSPIAAATWLAIVTSTVIPLGYYFSLNLFKNKFYASLVALLIAFSYESSQYSFYLANTALAVVTVPILYLGLWLWRQSKSFGPIIAGIGLGLTFQANFLLIYHFAVIMFLLVLRQLPINRKYLFTFLAFFALACSSMWISEIKFGLPSLSGPSHLLSRSGYSALHIDTKMIASGAFYQLERLISLNLLPQSPKIITIIFFGLLFVASFYKRPSWWWLMVIPLIAFMPPLVLGGISSPYVHAGLGLLVYILFISILSRFKLHPAIIGIFVIPIIFANYQYAKIKNSTGYTEFAIQKTMTLSNEIRALDYIYAEAQGRPFSINTIAAPLFINTTWSYLFNWYGQTRYSYIPYWHGRDQSPFLGNNLKSPDKSVKDYFVIIEPSQGLPEDLINQVLAKENSVSNFNHFIEFGEIKVQSRTAKN